MRCLLPIGLALVVVSQLGAGPGTVACDPAGNVRFVWDQSGPEDLVAVPRSPWVLASGYPEGSGAGTGSVHTLYGTHHGTRESVEVFELNVGGPTPVLTWVGCAVAPDPLNLNSVAALPGSGFAATSFRNQGMPIGLVMGGQISGAIWEWRPETGWMMVPGSETSGPNGIELSPDGRWFYLEAWGTQSVVWISRGRIPSQRDEVAAGFRGDNLRWAPDGSILAAGQGGFGSPTTTSNVARVDPSTWQLEEIVRYEDDETFGTGTGAL